MASQIKAIPQQSVHKITSGQVVVDLQTAVKELVENSLDAGATSIEVRFKDYGLKSIEVIDNGSGIKPADYESIGLKHHTSKLSSYADLESVTSFGFRGEAISSLCALAEGVTMTTATEDEAPMGTVLEFDRNGKLARSDAKVARQRGTSVTVTNLFAPLPVRRAELSRNIKREHSKAVALLTAYAMVPCANPPGVRLTVSNQPEGGKKSVQIRTDGTPNLRNNIASLWGRKALDNLVDVDLQLDVEAESSMLKRAGLGSFSTTVHCQGVASLPTFTSSRTAADRQFIFLNSRPCTLPKVTKAISEVWHSFCVQGHGMWVLDLTLRTDAYDVNVSPDKRSILLHNEDGLTTSLKAALEALWQPTRSTFAVNGGGSRSNSDRLTSGGVVNAEEELDELDEDDGNDEAPVRETKTFGGSRSRSQPKRLAERASTWPTGTASKKAASNGTRRSSKSDQALPAFESSETADTGDAPAGPPLVLNGVQTAAIDLTNEQGVPIFEEDAETSPVRHSQQPQTPPTADARDVASALPDVLIGSNGPETPARPHATQPDSSSSGFLAPPIPPEVDAAVLSLEEPAPGPEVTRERPLASDEPKAKRRKVALGEGSQMSVGQFQKRLQRFASGRTGPTAASTDESEHSEDERASGETDSDEEIVENSKNLRDKGHSDGTDHPLDDRSAAVIDLTEDDIQMDDVHIVADKIARSSDEHGLNGDLIDKAPTVEIVRNGSSNTGVLAIDMGRLRSKWSSMTVNSVDDLEPTDQSGRTMESAGLKVDSAEQAEATLSRVITKADFDRMEILGQFNLGFVIVRLKKEDDDGKKDYDELFIVDQHAADEKYNFETLQQTTRIQSQTLFRPRPLELTPADELVALENLGTLRANGFEVEEVETKQADETSVEERQSRLLLTAQPISKETIFDMKDLEELLHLMQDAPKGQMVRCSKARSMFAMRACRRSVMIGKALTKQQMTNVVRHMGTMDQPWNCPHGRPTMRHLLSMPDFLKRLSKKTEISWQDFNA